MRIRLLNVLSLVTAVIVSLLLCTAGKADTRVHSFDILTWRLGNPPPSPVDANIRVLRTDTMRRCDTAYQQRIIGRTADSASDEIEIDYLYDVNGPGLVTRIFRRARYAVSTEEMLNAVITKYGKVDSQSYEPRKRGLQCGYDCMERHVLRWGEEATASLTVTVFPQAYMSNGKPIGFFTAELRDKVIESSHKTSVFEKSAAAIAACDAARSAATKPRL